MPEIDELKEAKLVERRKNAELGGILAEEINGANTVGIEGVVDVAGEIVADRGG